MGQRVDDKLASLLSNHKAKGLCFKCGDKWGKGHTCPAQVPLHIVEEMMSAVHQSGSSLLVQTEESNFDDGLELMAVQNRRDQSTRKVKRPTMRLQGWVGKQHALILVDLGSATTFVSTLFVDKCGLPMAQLEHSQYTATDGGLMTCNRIVPKLQWFCQGYTFCRDTKVMQLPMCDIILGADSLEEQGTLWIDWKQKIMTFESVGKEITLSG
jgi:hypothetical protein